MDVNTSFSLPIQNFKSLDDKSKREIYQEANESHNIPVVRYFNHLGMKPEVAPFSGPTIISGYMDIATKYDTLIGFFKELRQTNRLLTEREFQGSSKIWFEKAGISRIFGCDHLKQKIMEVKSKYMKIPLKIMVVDDVDLLKVKGWNNLHNLYDIHSDQFRIFAEAVQHTERKLSREEIDELFHVITAANFQDLSPQNIVLANDGVYLIDTEFKSFEGSIDWKKMRTFESLISEEDKAYFEQKIQEKIKEPRVKKEIHEYNFLLNQFESYQDFDTLPEKHKEKFNELKNKISSLEYVGAKKVGAFITDPNKFTFYLRDIL